MSDFEQESVVNHLTALGIPILPGEIEEITSRYKGYIAHLEELRKLNLDGIYPMDSPPVEGWNDR